MLLKRLFDLAEQSGLLTDAAFDEAPVACLIRIGPTGEFLGLRSLRQPRTSGSPGVGSKPALDQGRLMAIPAQPVVLEWARCGRRRVKSNTISRWKLTDAASSGHEKPAVFLADNIGRVLPVQRLIKDCDRTRLDAQRSTFWRFIQHTAGETNDPALRALERFGDWLNSDPQAGERLAREIEAHGLSLPQLCTFTWTPEDSVDEPILARAAVRDWWRAFFAADQEEQRAREFHALCQVTEAAAAIPSSVKSKINGLTTIGCRADAYLVTGVDSSASYGMSGSETGMVSARGTDGVTRALNGLISNRLPGRAKSSLRIGDAMFLYWSTGDGPNPMELLEQPDPAAIAALSEGVETPWARPNSSRSDFHCLVISGNSARVVVRDFMEEPLSKVRANLAAWYRDLDIVDISSGARTCCFPFWALASSTVRGSDDLPVDLTTMLARAALRGAAVPWQVLAALLRRIRLEVASHHNDIRRNSLRPARMGLIQLILKRMNNRGEYNMSEPSMSASQGYACGQLLTFLARCQSPRDFGAGAQLTERYFGSASTSPRSVFPILLRLNRQHIRKVHEMNASFGLNLEAELEARLAPFQTLSGTGPDFPELLSLPEQGRFALGFYHQRAHYRAAWMEREALRQGAELERAQN